jgi:glutaredoxin 3
VLGSFSGTTLRYPAVASHEVDPMKLLKMFDRAPKSSEKKGSANLRLYVSPYCGYCFMVRDAAEQLGVELEVVDVYKDPLARKALVERRGRGTVPVLEVLSEDDSRLIPESRDIIRFLSSYVSAT